MSDVTVFFWSPHQNPGHYREMVFPEMKGRELASLLDFGTMPEICLVTSAFVPNLPVTLPFHIARSPTTTIPHALDIMKLMEKMKPLSDRTHALRALDFATRYKVG